MATIPSLALIPSGYKASKVYSVLPTDGSGDLTFTRAADTATRVNSDGLIESVLANIPRLDYLGSSCPRLLLEPQRTNLALYSEQFDNAAWAKGAVSVTANNAVSPDGYTNADLITADGTNTQHYVLQTQTQSAKTISFFVKMGTQRFVQILTGGSSQAVANYDLQTGAVGGLGAASTASMVDYGNGWWRLILTSSDALTSNVYLCYCNSLVQGRFPSTTSTGTIWAWGAMAENGATYASSYVNTLGAAVTRGADSASKTGISSLIGQTEGTLFVDFESGNFSAASAWAISVNDGTTSNHIGIRKSGSAEYFASLNAAGVVQALFSLGFDDGRHKVALAYSNNDVVAYVDGVLAGSDTSATIPATSVLDVGNLVSGRVMEGAAYQALLFKTRLTNAQLAELTTI
jgi:hypothetical protein